MALKKDAITKSIFDRLDLTKAASVTAVEATFEIIKKALVVERTGAFGFQRFIKIYRR